MAFSLDYAKHTNKGKLKCGFCGKPGHHKDQCYKYINALNAGRTPETPKQPGAQKVNGKLSNKSSRQAFIPKYFKCGIMGHVSTKCPKNNRKNNTPEQANTLECNHFTDSMEEEVLMTCQDCQSVPDFAIETAFSATITRPLYSFGPANNLRNWLIDSGATSHFTPHPKHLRDMEPCQIEVTVADESTVLATHIGKVNASEETTSEAQKIPSLMPMEMAHLKMGHKSIRSLMTGLLHQVWSG
eukprot:11366403-Ditylum_brightwellii.AAC.1